MKENKESNTSKGVNPRPKYKKTNKTNKRLNLSINLNQ
jgi:hypothetical protein